MSEQQSVFSSVAVTDRGARALDRLKEVTGTTELPPAFDLFAGSENGINDLYMNINRQLADGKLERRVKLLVAAAAASNAGSKDAVDFFARAAIAAGRTPADVLEAIGSAATCAVFNSWYRFRDQVPEDSKAAFEAMRAPFNANAFVKPALPLLEIEAVCIAVSSLNGCHKCVEGHMAKGKSVGLTDEQIDEIIRAAAVANAAARVAMSFAPAVAPVTA